MNHLSFAFAGLLLFACSFTALAQERPWDSSGCAVAETTVLDKAGDSVIMYGMSRGNADSTVFGRMSYECRGVTNASKEGVEFSNRCTFVDAEGNKLFVSNTGSPKGWESKFVGGGGKWEGITGSGKGSGQPGYGRISATLAGGCYKANGTYALKRAQ